MNPLEQLNQRQRKARREAAESGNMIQANAVKPLIIGLDIGKQPVGFEFGKLEQYQAAVDAAISAMAPMEAKGAERTAYKRETALPGILPFVQSYIAKWETYPNSVAVQAMIWLFDVGEIEPALDTALYLVKTKNQIMPEKFDRDLPTFICDAVYDWAKDQLDAKNPASPYLQTLLDTITADQWSLHPAVHSKLFAMAAKHAEREENWQACIQYCDKAQQVNPEGAGVKTMKQRAAAKLATA